MLNLSVIDQETAFFDIAYFFQFYCSFNLYTYRVGFYCFSVWLDCAVLSALFIESFSYYCSFVQLNSSFGWRHLHEDGLAEQKFGTTWKENDIVLRISDHITNDVKTSAQTPTSF